MSGKIFGPLKCFPLSFNVYIDGDLVFALRKAVVTALRPLTLSQLIVDSTQFVFHEEKVMSIDSIQHIQNRYRKPACE